MNGRNAIAVLTILMWAAGLTVASSADGDALLGRYWNPDRSRQVEITREGEIYVGRVIWEAREEGDESHLGREIIRGFRYAGKGEWTDGEVVAPEGGRVYRGRLWLEDGDLMMRGFVGFDLLGRTARLERVRSASAYRG
ncbi:MAG: DUF2147 domain-containing protein [Myxococcota bacterium]